MRPGTTDYSMGVMFNPCLQAHLQLVTTYKLDSHTFTISISFIYLDDDCVRQVDNYEFVLEDVSHFAETGQTFADKINSKIEKSILEAPEQYLWHHRRFKSQKPEIYD